MSYVLDYQQNRLSGESKFCPLDLMRQKFCKTPWCGGSCCRNSATLLISRCRNSARTLDVVLQKFYKTPWLRTAETLQDPLNSCCRNSARPLIACLRNSAAPLIACLRNSAAPDLILLDLMLYKFCSLLIWCWCRRISVSLVTRGRIISVAKVIKGCRVSMARVTVDCSPSSSLIIKVCRISALGNHIV